MLVFVDGATNVGGYTTLVTNVVSELFSRGIICKVFCTNTSVLFKVLNDHKIDFIQINPSEIGNFSHHINKDDVLISGLFPLSLLEELYTVNPYFCFYNLAPDILIRIQKSTGFLTKKSLKLLLSEMNNKNGLYFMDGSGFNTIQSLFKLNCLIPNYLPVSVSNSKFINRYKPKNYCKIITYLGRGVEWKIFPVKKLITDLVKSNFMGEVHILTDSDKLFKDMLHSVINKNIVVKYILGLNENALDDYLQAYSDLNVAMGISALESAKMGIPTILVDMAYNDYPDNYLYRWLFQNNSTYNLGFLLDGNVSNIGSPIHEIINGFKKKNFISEISTQCFNYAYKNHSSDIIAAQFALITDNIEFKVNDFRKYKFFKYYLNMKKLSSFLKLYSLGSYNILIKLYKKIHKDV